MYHIQENRLRPYSGCYNNNTPSLNLQNFPKNPDDITDTFE